MTKNIVFVYGTLMKEMGNDHYLEKSEYLGDGMTDKEYSMYVDIVIPKITLTPRYKIEGELYLVSDEDMVLVDELEGKYSKMLTTVYNKKNKKFVDAFIYVWERPIIMRNDVVINRSGSYREYMDD
tara:strand:- start:1735 stop:2112 length:378 start_codon:yes stop_codon:yes gene_type:complete